jgi:hypothetical protein
MHSMARLNAIELQQHEVTRESHTSPGMVELNTPTASGTRASVQRFHSAWLQAGETYSDCRRSGADARMSGTGSRQ